MSLQGLASQVDDLDDRWDRIRVAVSALQVSHRRLARHPLRHLPSIAEARERYPHGTEARYVLGRCQCFPCRVAHSRRHAEQMEGRHPIWRVHAGGTTREGGHRYRVRHVETREEALCTADREEAHTLARKLNARDVEGSPYQLIPTGDVVKHIGWLQRNGIGPKTISAVSGVSYSVLQRMLGYPSGGPAITRTRRATAERILAVGFSDAVGAQKVPADPTWELIGCLLRAGWRKYQVAVAVTPSSGARIRKGSRPGLQIRKDLVRASTARAVERVHAEAWHEDARVREVCTHLHVPDDREAEYLRRRRTRQRVA